MALVKVTQENIDRIIAAINTRSKTTDVDNALAGKVNNSQVLTNVPAGAVFTDTVYTHPTGDSNLHVPATGTDNNGKVLKAGSTAGSISWGTLAKADVGLGDLDNTTDANKPVSTAQAAAIALKVTANAAITAGTATKITYDAKGLVTAGGTLVASDIPNLDASKLTSGVIAAERLPSYVDDVLEYEDLASFPATGETSKIYVAADTNKTYRWGGSTYVYITSGAVDSVAGKSGVVTLVKSDVGLGSVDNTTDANKPVSTAQQTALDLKANLASPTFTGTVAGITKAMVGLDSVDNTTDANKPVSTAQQTALDLKADSASVYTKTEVYAKTEFADVNLTSLVI